IFDETGALRMLSGNPGAVEVSIADRAYFAYHRDNAERGLRISVPVLSRASGRWVLPLSRRVDRPDGSFGGVVAAVIELAYFT
ncbi:hypothetical protein KC220_26000, partial [Mycobacterium tuberculosis]|nr:hypothetical protein [Mycobacterium tuberculosis]